MATRWSAKPPVEGSSPSRASNRDVHDHGSRGRRPAAVAGRGWRALFEDRYGDGSAERLKSMLEQPCVTFARIAAEFGVTRECVRLWHQRLLPDAPRGHQRQQLCREHQMKRRLLEDALFLRFYRHVRSSVPQQRVTLIPSRDGFRKRTVSIDGRTIALGVRAGPGARLALVGRSSIHSPTLRPVWISSTTSFQWRTTRSCRERAFRWDP